jgi:L-amino acid N-acyltransferase YncA
MSNDMPLTHRHAILADAEAITAIYNPYILNTLTNSVFRRNVHLL